MMKVLALLLVFAALSSALPLLPGVVDMSMLAGTPVPGTMMGFGSGYDVKIERVRMPIFQYTYQYEQEWTNPYNGKTYTYPDQTYLTEMPKGKITKETALFQDFHSYVKTVTDHFGIDIGLSYGGKDIADINFQRSHGKVDEMIKGGTNNFAQENRYLPFYQLDLWPDAEINVHMKRLIDDLPNTISSAADTQKYAAFVAAVGTHYTVSAQFGGFLNFTSIFNVAMTKRHTQEWTAYQVKLSLQWQEIKAGIDWNRNKSIDKLDQDYYEHSFNETNCIGGRCFLIEDARYDEWAKSIPDMPGMIPAYQILYPVTDLILNNATKRKTLHDYVLGYLSKKEAVADHGDWQL